MAAIVQAPLIVVGVGLLLMMFAGIPFEWGKNCALLPMNLPAPDP
jgi:hypothetical protein